MHEVLLQAGNLCSCKNRRLNAAFLQMGVVHSANLEEGTIRVKYDEQLIFLVEIIEAIESCGCSVEKFIRTFT